MHNRTGLVMPHRRRKGEELPDWKQAHNKSHKKFRTRVEEDPPGLALQAMESTTSCSASPACTASTSLDRRAVGLSTDHIHTQSEITAGQASVDGRPPSRWASR